MACITMFKNIRNQFWLGNKKARRDARSVPSVHEHIETDGFCINRPKVVAYRSVLVLGAGPIVIGQGCEFDYAGTQACKALKEEGCRVILINPNPATIMTDPALADGIYSEPLQWDYIEKVIAQEKPDALLPTMGGQTALNCTLELASRGILQKHGVQLIGVTIDTIRQAEDRGQFKQILERLQLDHAHSVTIRQHNMHVAFPYPRILRTSFSLGGSGSGIVHNEAEYEAFCTEHFTRNPDGEIHMEESLLGWKEFELEVMRDGSGNCIVVCAIENLDPMGVHTGDSITVAPAQTLTDKEYQRMRNWAFQLMAAVGMTSGGCNVQFAVHPHTGRMVVIEMNPRVSRSSALASKATGYPIARIATKLALGYTLDEISNPLLQGIPASFEPSLDYVVVKIPRFNFEKFPGVDRVLTTQMKSVGEAMGLGRTFPEALRKALDSLEYKWDGLLPPMHTVDGMDPWFLDQMQAMPTMPGKRVYKRIDSCAGEFPSQVPILYSTQGQACEAAPSDRKKIIILGSGPNRIGQGLEFDYCCVQAMEAVRELGYEGIMINSNPSTVSTDFDVSDKLYFEPLTPDYVAPILNLENPVGVMTQFGGQTSLMLAGPLAAKGVPILGTQCDGIHQAEDRQAFKKLLDTLGLQQPPNDTFQTAQEALDKVAHIGYPCILRPSYVLGGRGLTKIHNRGELETYLATFDVTHPILMERFMAHAMELDVDAIHDGQTTLICGILEQLESAGIHSGDSSCIFPTVNVPMDMLDKIKAQTHAIAKALHILGFLNIQFLIQDGELYVLEANPRASRTIPFVSKATGVPLVKIATRVILGQSLKEQGYISNTIASHDESQHTLETSYASIPAPNLFFLKKPVFSFSKLPGADTILGPEMKSTGELMLVGRTVDEVMAKGRGERFSAGMGVYGLPGL